MNTGSCARRDLLKAWAWAGCLPLLHVEPELWAAATTPKRLLIVMHTEGYRQQYWRPMDGT